jgi:hypothetical protein
MVLASENEVRMMPLRQKRGDWTVELRRMMGSPMINWWPWQQLGDFRISKHFKPGWFIVPKIVGQTPETWSCCGDRNGCEPSIPYPSTLRSRFRELSTFSDSVWIHRDYINQQWVEFITCPYLCLRELLWKVLPV